MENSFDKTVEMIDDADAIFLSNFDKEMGLVCGEPYNTKTGQVRAMAMVSSIEEAITCKYIKVFDADDKDLEKAINVPFFSANPTVTVKGRMLSITL